MGGTDEQKHTLYAHAKRPTWGLAILAKEDRDARQYQFQDGQLRTFKRGYYELLEVVEAPPRALEIVRDLQAMLRLERGRRESGGASRTAERAVRWDDQLRLFEEEHPGGFDGPKWIEEVRGSPERGNRREGAIAQARARFAAAELDRALATGASREVVEGMRRTLAASDLAGSKDLSPIRAVAGSDPEEIVRALRALLWGSGSYGPRFDAYVAALRRAGGARVSWPLATAGAALVQPEKHVAIKPSAFRLQAQWMAPGLVYAHRPSGALYAQLLAMAEDVRERLVRAGHRPRDLLDVHDFILRTLRPTALAKLARRR